MLYNKILDAPRPDFSVPPPPKSNKDFHDGDGMIVTTSTKSTMVTSKKAHIFSNQYANEELLALEFNVVLTNKGKELKQPGGKKKGKREKKKQDDSSHKKSSANPSGQRKPPRPCHICDEDHWMKDCPHKAKVMKFLKTLNTLAMLTNPFPSPKKTWLLSILLPHPKFL